MERSEAMRATVNVTSALSGALIGATIGMIDGVVGATVGAVAGVLSGALAANAITRRRRARDVDAIEDATWASMIEPPRVNDGDLHVRQHPRAHVHYEYPPTFATGSMLLRPSF